MPTLSTPSIHIPSFSTPSIKTPDLGDVAGDVTDALGAVAEVAADTAAVVAGTVRRRPRYAGGVAIGLVALLAIVFVVRRKRGADHRADDQTGNRTIRAA